MELREGLEEARAAGDRAARMARLVKQVEQAQHRGVAELAHCLDEGTAAGHARARARVREMQFLRKVMHEIEELDDLD
jgi:hypothetical protein